MSDKSPKRRSPAKKRASQRSSHNFIKIFGIFAAITVGVFVAFNSQQTQAVLSDVSTEIVGGSSVPGGKYPFQVALLYTGEGTPYDRQFCGGSLISTTHVLTAAHCVEDIFSPEEVEILIGRTSLNASGGETRVVKEIKIHPGYNSLTAANDAAVIVLDAPITNYEPITLAGSGDNRLEKDGNKLTVIGWGSVRSVISKRKDKKPKYPVDLREVRVPVVEDKACNKAYKTSISFGVSICAGKKRADSCQGDSGGPLFTRRKNGNFVQVGIVSWGRGCADPKFPGIYTEINAKSIHNFITGAMADNPEPTPPTNSNAPYFPPTRTPSLPSIPPISNSSYNVPYQSKN